MTKEENEKRLEHLRGIVSNLPSKPGSYQYYDKEGTIIYVGKAKNLKSRVSSYFHKEVDRYKTKVLVSKIWDITYTVVNSEEDALLLENNLIKKYQPKYNILLKDGKTYPSISIEVSSPLIPLHRSESVFKARVNMLLLGRHAPSSAASLLSIRRDCKCLLKVYMFIKNLNEAVLNS